MSRIEPGRRMTNARATICRTAGILVLLCCNAANADLGLIEWVHETGVMRDGQLDLQRQTPSLLPGAYLQESAAQIGGTSVDATYSAALASDRIEITITSNHVTWAPSTPDESVLTFAHARFKFVPTQDVVVSASGAMSYDVPLNDTVAGLYLEVFDYNNVLYEIRAQNEGAGVDSIERNDDFTLTAGSIYLVAIDTVIESFDQALPASPATASGRFDLTIVAIPEPATLKCLLFAAAVAFPRRPRRPHPR